MYYIYHIPNVKIGCTKRLEKRMKEQYSANWELLETHLDIEIASNREIELQKQYGYKVDTLKYSKYDYSSNGKIGGKLGGVTSKPSIKFKELNEKRKRAINVYDFKTGKFIGEYESMYLASIELTLNPSLMHAVLNGTRNKHKGYAFKYKTPSKC